MEKIPLDVMTIVHELQCSLRKLELLLLDQLFGHWWLKQVVCSYGYSVMSWPQ